MPRPEEIIRGGGINTIGEYSESGIKQANQDRPDVMTAGALRFWQLHAAERQTIVYAMSQEHARNLTTVFNEAGIPSAVMLGDTMPLDRAEAINAFGSGALRVLVNVAVATEGFDLPDASCIVITRPTMSLALYLQMVGRGLRPKASGSDCLILDLAGNSYAHGLPEDIRQWSLEPRGNRPGGDAPVVRCERCDAVSPAASHFCVYCQTPFGKDCTRCGTWRAWQRWSYETHCGERHESVCDLCHHDAHIQASLPVTEELRRLSNMEPDLDSVLQRLLEEERQRASGADEGRKKELRSLIAAREAELSGDGLLQAFRNHIAELPEGTRPKTELEEYRLFPEWEHGLKRDVADWKEELDKLESKLPDRRLIYNNARERVLRALEAQAQETGLLQEEAPIRSALARRPVAEVPAPAPTGGKEWMSFVQLGEWGKASSMGGRSVKPIRFRDPTGNEVSLKTWADLLFQTADWLAQEGLLYEPFTFKSIRKWLINTEPIHPNGREFRFGRQLSNGLFIDVGDVWSAKTIAQLSGRLLTEFGQDPAHFQVVLG